MLSFSLIETEAMQTEEFMEAIANLEAYTWLVFTSSNGVDIFFDYLIACGKDIRCLSALRFAVIGEGTKEALKKRGIQADFVPSRYSSCDLAKEWVPALTEKDKVLLLRAEEASVELNKALDKAKISYQACPIYHTKVDKRKGEELNRILPQVDYITFASASAVKAFASMAAVDNVQAKIVCIGPVTEKVALSLGFTVHKSAVEYTAEGIRDVLLYDKMRG